MSVGAMTFLPFARAGLANRIGTPDFAAGVQLRATINVKLQLTGEAGGAAVSGPLIDRDVPLVGPGDIVGLDRRAIIRTEPRDGVTNVEPNYLAAIEFYDEDLPWRYTPAAPSTSAPYRLRPWLALIVLAEDEFSDHPYDPARPLPAIDVTDAGLFPPGNEMAGWAHVHYNRSLLAPGVVRSTDPWLAAAVLKTVLDSEPDLGWSRLLSPRALAANTAYTAFLMPVFESGRLAGLGLDPSATPSATHCAWDAYSGRNEATLFPYYHRFYFRTGGAGDFEYLVRLLKPRQVDRRVGRRDIDANAPGWGLRGAAGPGGVLKLGGALRAPPSSLPAADKVRYDAEEAWDTPYPTDFQEDLARFVNLSDSYTVATAPAANAAFGHGAIAANPDPMVTPPIYGRWHALRHRLLHPRGDNSATVPNHRNWLHNLNLDPRHRVAAGMGTAVVQKDQEKLMRDAWAQVGDVIEANRLLRLSQLSADTSSALYQTNIRPLAQFAAERALSVTAPVQARVMAGGVTVRHLVQRSATPAAMISPGMRRIVRPGGALAQGLGFTAAAPAAAAIGRINSGAIGAAPPRQAPAGLALLDHAAAAVAPRGLAGPLAALLARVPQLPALAIAVGVALGAVLIAVGGVAGVAAAGLAVGAGAWAAGRLRAIARAASASAALGEAAMNPASVDRMPANAGFRLDSPTRSAAGPDSPDAAQFRQALKEAYAGIQSRASAVPPPPEPLDLGRLALDTVAALDPTVTMQRWADSKVSIPRSLATATVRSGLAEVMCYPSFDTPMYKPLVERSAELFLPNIHLIPENSITLLETNQAFIEAYLVGLNHEFARELLWRFYPTDQRGSFFRQFWDAASYLDPAADPAAAREKLRDIPPIHRWAAASRLGDHDNRQGTGPPRADLVLTIRGDLLAKYPTAVIYAHKARWQPATGPINNKLQRLPVELSPAEEASPPAHLVRTPLYQAKVEPDIYFLGFDLTATEARGRSGDDPADDAGWFFVIKERPSEPRFGLDTGPAAASLNVWNDLNWAKALTAGRFLPMTRPAPLALVPPGSASEKHAQWSEDQFVEWGPNSSSADLAYILYQAPVLVATHAAEMLGAA